MVAFACGATACPRAMKTIRGCENSTVVRDWILRVMLNMLSKINQARMYLALFLRWPPSFASLNFSNPFVIKYLLLTC